MADACTPYTENQKTALKALKTGPASFTRLMALGSTGTAAAWLVKQGFAEFTVGGSEKLLALTEAGLRALQALA